MATLKLYEPAARFFHASCSLESGVFVRGGCTSDFKSGSKDARIKLANSIELFDLYLEAGRKFKLTRQGPLIRDCMYLAACASVADEMYMYGVGRELPGVLNYFDIKLDTALPRGHPGWCSYEKVTMVVDYFKYCPQKVGMGYLYWPNPIRRKVCQEQQVQ